MCFHSDQWPSPQGKQEQQVKGCAVGSVLLGLLGGFRGGRRLDVTYLRMEACPLGEPGQGARSQGWAALERPSWSRSSSCPAHQ